MTEVASRAVSPQATPAIESVRALLRAGRNDEAIVALCAELVVRPDDLAVRELLFDAFFQKRDWKPAFALIQTWRAACRTMRACKNR